MKPYGTPLVCPKCGYGWLKLPDQKAPAACPNDGMALRKPQPSLERK